MPSFPTSDLNEPRAILNSPRHHGLLLHSSDPLFACTASLSTSFTHSAPPSSSAPSQHTTLPASFPTLSTTMASTMLVPSGLSTSSEMTMSTTLTSATQSPNGLSTASGLTTSSIVDRQRQNEMHREAEDEMMSEMRTKSQPDQKGFSRQSFGGVKGENKGEENFSTKTKKEYNHSNTQQTYLHHHPFHMRRVNLANFPISHISHRSTFRSQNQALHKAVQGSEVDSKISLETLRKVLQTKINLEIRSIIDKYIEKYFKPAIRNIAANLRQNEALSRNAGGDEKDEADDFLSIKQIAADLLPGTCRNILEESKQMYKSSCQTLPHRFTSRKRPANEMSDNRADPKTSPYSYKSHKGNHSRSNVLKDNGNSDRKLNLLECKVKHQNYQRTSHSALASSVFTNETSMKMIETNASRNNSSTKKRGLVADSSALHKPCHPVFGQWDAPILNQETRFVMGSVANKAVGMGNTRGRIYTKHPQLFKYASDAEDKQWLFETGLLRATGGKAYLLIIDEVRHLTTKLDEYPPIIDLDAKLGPGFTVPDSMLRKMQKVMHQHMAETLDYRPDERPDDKSMTAPSQKTKKTVKAQTKKKNTENILNWEKEDKCGTIVTAKTFTDSNQCSANESKKKVGKVNEESNELDFEKSSLLNEGAIVKDIVTGYSSQSASKLLTFPAVSDLSIASHAKQVDVNHPNTSSFIQQVTEAADSHVQPLFMEGDIPGFSDGGEERIVRCNLLNEVGSNQAIEDEGGDQIVATSNQGRVVFTNETKMHIDHHKLTFQEDNEKMLL